MKHTYPLMKYTFPFGAVVALVLFAWIGSSIPGMKYLFGVFIPYIAVALFIGGFCYKIIQWAKSPVPFKITTTCGQGKSLPWIKHDALDAPNNGFQVAARMFFEIVLFRSLWKNTKASVYDGPKVTYESSKWLWAFALMFHYGFLLVVIRHMRFVLDPIPAPLVWLGHFDSIFHLGVPPVYLSSLALLGGLFFLFARRITNRQVRYISLANDYFPIFLILGIVITGILMRMFIRTDIDLIAIRQLTMGLVTFSPTTIGDIGSIFYIHFFLVCVLLAYFPFSKLMHMGGVFLSPTRNMANDSRMRRHINPWNPEIKPHSYADYEDEFRADMVEQGIPVDKPLAEKNDAEAEKA